MARTNKIGIDYFPFDVDFFQDEKVQFISARFGVKGESITIRLLCKIYRNGYYTEWNDDTALLFAKSVGDGCQDTCVKDVVYELLKRGFFDRSIFERFGILTSRGIQNRYFEAIKRYKSIDVFGEYLLVDVSKIDNVNINTINVNINSNNVNINSQIEKEKEIEKENKEKIKKENFAEFVSMTNDEYSSLVAKVGSEEGARRCIEILDNYKGAKGAKYKSDYRAILNWVISKYLEENAKRNAKKEQTVEYRKL